MNGKERADVALVKRGLFESREKAQAAIMAGEVYVGERKINKASDNVAPEDEFILREKAIKYVSRGALKLEKAIVSFHADLNGKTVMDIGSSTGGFTDICLRNGAKHVYSIDVGYGQLDWKLRNDPRVTVMERTNARYLKREDFPTQPEITVMDVSFISIKMILPAAIEIMGDCGIFYTLIKPQFEAGREYVGKNGVVRNPDIHIKVLRDITEFVRDLGWQAVQTDYSPITGPEGNIEFLAEIRKREEDRQEISENRIREIVAEAHEKLERK